MIILFATKVAEHDNLDIMALKRVKEFAESEHQGELVALAVMMYDYTDGDNSPQGTNPLPVQELVDALCNPKLEDKTKVSKVYLEYNNLVISCKIYIFNLSLV